MKTQSDTQTQTVKKLTLSKETITKLTSGQLSKESATLTRIC